MNNVIKTPQKKENPSKKDKKEKKNEKDKKEKKNKKDKREKKDTYLDILDDCQRDAVKYFFKKAKVFSKGVELLLLTKIIELGYTKNDYKQLVNDIKTFVKPIIHFNGNNIGLILNENRYKSTFEIQKKGSSYQKWRDRKEGYIFNKFYENASDRQKVKYGALNMLNMRSGITSARGYGTCYFVLKDDVKKRLSFVHCNSSENTMHIATYKHFDHILYYMPSPIIKEMIEKTGKDIRYNYVECQIHGDIMFNRDIEKFMIDSKLALVKIELIKQFCVKNGMKFEII